MEPDPRGHKWPKVLRFLVNVDEVIAGYEGMTLTGLNLKKQDKGWFMVVAAKRPGGERVVAYFAGHRPYECLWLLAYQVVYKQVQWKPDKYQK